MSTLQAKINAKRWFELAITKNKLADFIIGLPPYAEHRPDDGGLPMPVLVPNVEILYDYHEKNKEIHFDTEVQNAVLQIAEDKGDHAYVLLHALIFVVTHLAYEKRGAASFVLNCPRILDAIRGNLAKNKKKFIKESKNKEVLGYIEFYAHLLCEQHNMSAVF